MNMHYVVVCISTQDQPLCVWVSHHQGQEHYKDDLTEVTVTLRHLTQMDVEFGTEQDLKKDLGEISSRLHDANLHNPKDLRGDEEPVFPEKTEKGLIKYRFYLLMLEC